MLKTDVGKTLLNIDDNNKVVKVFKENIVFLRINFLYRIAVIDQGINVLRAAFTRADPESAEYIQLVSFWELHA